MCVSCLAYAVTWQTHSTEALFSFTVLIGDFLVVRAVSRRGLHLCMRKLFGRALQPYINVALIYIIHSRVYIDLALMEQTVFSSTAAISSSPCKLIKGLEWARQHSSSRAENDDASPSSSSLITSSPSSPSLMPTVVVKSLIKKPTGTLAPGFMCTLWLYGTMALLL